MRVVRRERVVLVPVDGQNARELWEVLNEPDLRKYQDIPRVRVEEFERQVRTRPKALRSGATPVICPLTPPKTTRAARVKQDSTNGSN